MAESQHSSHENEDLDTTKEAQILKIANYKRGEEKGFLKRYIFDLKEIYTDERLEKMAIGEKNESKPHKTILVVGETGTGKSTFINAFFNYILGVNINDRIWCEIIETTKDQTASKTKAVTMYDVFVEQSPFSLTIIDTPGYGSTEGIEKDLTITETLHELFKSEDGVHELDLVCLLVSSATTRLTLTQKYVFDAILSLFGKDVEKNIIVVITRAPKKPINAIKAIKESNIKCAKTEDGEPVYFRFDNFHCKVFFETTDEAENYTDYEESLGLFQKNMENLFVFLDNALPVPLSLTESVLRKRKQLKACIRNVRDKVQHTEAKKAGIEQEKTALKQFIKENKKENDFTYEVDEPYKEKVPIQSKWWQLDKEATCCSVCKENCHYPGCWWVRDLSWCSVMTNGKCTVCTSKCDYTDHVKEGKIYVQKTRRVKKTYKDLKQKYEKHVGEKMSLMSFLEQEIKNHSEEKARLVEEMYQIVMSLADIALKTDSVSTLDCLDFLIEKIKETKNMDRVKILEDIKNKAEAANKGLLGYVRKILDS